MCSYKYATAVDRRIAADSTFTTITAKRCTARNRNSSGTKLPVDDKPPRAHRRGTGEGRVVSAYSEAARALLFQRTSAAENMGEINIIAAIDNQFTVVDDIAVDRASAAAIADLKRTCRDGGRTCIIIVAGDCQLARTAFFKCTRATDLLVIRKIVRTVHDKRRIVYNIAVEFSAGAAGAQLKRTAVNRRKTSIGAITRQNERARTNLLQRTCAGDCARVRVGIGTIERQSAAVGDTTRYGAGSCAVTNLQHTTLNHSIAGIGVCTSQNRSTSAALFQYTGTTDHS